MIVTKSDLYNPFDLRVIYELLQLCEILNIFLRYGTFTWRIFTWWVPKICFIDLLEGLSVAEIFIELRFHFFYTYFFGFLNFLGPFRNNIAHFYWLPLVAIHEFFGAIVLHIQRTVRSIKNIFSWLIIFVVRQEGIAEPGNYLVQEILHLFVRPMHDDILFDEQVPFLIKIIDIFHQLELPVGLILLQ